MDNRYQGSALNGLTWRDLHYTIAGKQVPGMVAASFAYLFSPKFLQANGGWKDVIWVSPNVAEKAVVHMRDDIIIGNE